MSVMSTASARGGSGNLNTSIRSVSVIPKAALSDPSQRPYIRSISAKRIRSGDGRVEGPFGATEATARRGPIALSGDDSDRGAGVGLRVSPGVSSIGSHASEGKPVPIGTVDQTFEASFHSEYDGHVEIDTGSEGDSLDDDQAITTTSVLRVRECTLPRGLHLVECDRSSCVLVVACSA